MEKTKHSYNNTHKKIKKNSYVKKLTQTKQQMRQDKAPKHLITHCFF